MKIVFKAVLFGLKEECGFEEVHDFGANVFYDLQRTLVKGMER